MDRITQLQLIRNWIIEVGRDAPFYRDAYADILGANERIDSRWRRGSLGRLLIEDDRLVLSQEDDRIVFGQFVGNRENLGTSAAFLLNGDGFDNDWLTQLQTQLRNQIQRLFSNSAAMIIPFRALESANIKFDSILPIEVTQDRNEDVFTPLPGNRVPMRENIATWSGLSRKIGRFNGLNWHVVLRGNETIQSRRVQFSLNNDNWTWRQVRKIEDKWCVVSRRHTLGSSIFSAIVTKNRHSYISAFDENEITPFYFLAQLPDNENVSTYREAINALAPPIVRKYRQENGEPPRQGDIFFLPTNLKTEDLGTPTKREDVTNWKTPIRRPDRRFHTGERVTHKYATNVSLKEGADPNSIMIYGTGHTATEVITKDGSMFVRGTVYHDPNLEETGRTREHRTIRLGNKWHLCVRNTVPQQ